MVLNQDEFLVVFIHSALMDNSQMIDITELFEVPKIFRVLVNDTQSAMKAQDRAMLAKLRPYIKELCLCLEEQTKIQKAKKLSESDILEYFKTHEQERAMFYGLLKQHLRVVSALRPDIVQGYEYYQSFLKLCEQDKGKNEYRLVRLADKSYSYALFTPKRLKELGA